MPIKNCSSDQKEKVVSTVNNILSSHKDEGGLAQVTDYEKRLDQLVYDIYSITKDEIEIIEKS